MKLIDYSFHRYRDVRNRSTRLPILLSSILICTCGVVAARAESEADAIERAQQSIGKTDSKVFRDSVAARWMPSNDEFWYRVKISADAFEYVRVNAVTGNVRRAESPTELEIPGADSIKTSESKRLRPLRTRSTGEPTTLRVQNSLDDSVEIFWVDTKGIRRPYGRVRPGTSKELSTYEGHVWLLSDPTGTPIGFYKTPLVGLDIEVNGVASLREKSIKPEDTKSTSDLQSLQSSLKVIDHNLVWHSAEGSLVQLTSDGTNENPYRGPIVWAPDSKHAVAQRVHDVARREVTIVDTSPNDQLQPKLLTYDYFKPGDPLPKSQPVIIALEDHSVRIVSDELFPNPFTESGRLDIRWSSDSREFYFNYNQRGHQLYRIIAVDATTGNARPVIEETSDTFIEHSGKTWREWLPDTNELLWMSERDGWTHLYLYDVHQGLKNQITRGQWVVRDVLKVDTNKRQIWFMASGLSPSQDPYYRHLCRVNFDGSELRQLTSSDGDHRIEFSPDDRYFIDRWSRVDQGTVTELRKCHDGSLVCELERADIQPLLDAEWSVPERFHSKGRDGETEIYGILIKPSNFDPSKKYPVVEEIYAGPHGSFCPKSFGRLTRQHAIAELGCIVVQVDGMGTDDRGKAFHQISWKNLEDAGFQDRIAWIQAAARTRPWMDLSRVGIYGGSAGGQTAMRALIDHHEFYDVAVADCGCHDNRMDKIWWNEQWLGWPIDESYIRSSNAEHAHRMQGKLLLIVGELDTNVDPASTMQVVKALQKANKDFEFMPIIGAGHGAAETPFGSTKRMQFLFRHLIASPP